MLQFINPKKLQQPIKVKLNGKIVGEIRIVQHPSIANETGWQYFPKGSKSGGVVFLSLTGVKKSLF